MAKCTLMLNADNIYEVYRLLKIKLDTIMRSFKYGDNLLATYMDNNHKRPSDKLNKQIYCRIFYINKYHLPEGVKEYILKTLNELIEFQIKDTSDNKIYNFNLKSTIFDCLKEHHIKHFLTAIVSSMSFKSQWFNLNNVEYFENVFILTTGMCRNKNIISLPMYMIDSDKKKIIRLSEYAPPLEQYDFTKSNELVHTLYTALTTYDFKMINDCPILNHDLALILENSIACLFKYGYTNLSYEVDDSGTITLDTGYGKIHLSLRGNNLIYNFNMTISPEILNSITTDIYDKAYEYLHFWYDIKIHNIIQGNKNHGTFYTGFDKTETCVN